MSDQEIVVTKRRVNRLNLDSEEEARIQEEERQRQEQIRLKKQQKRRRREQEAKKVQQQEKRRIELHRHYEDPQTMLQPDSGEDDHFQRAQKKIKKGYPQYHSKRRESSQSQEQESQQQSESGSQSEEESRPKKKAQKKVKNQRKQRRKQESQEVRAPRQKVQKVKVEEKDPKEKLVDEVAIRWWYCLPQWPPTDYDYEGQLKKLGYRLVENNRFRMQENLVNGLYKATTVDGYVGVFKTKLKIIDIRPKQKCPSLQFLRNKSKGQLTSLLKTALKEQIYQLTNQQFQGNGDLQLIEGLTRQLNLLNE